MIKYNTYGEKNNPTILILTGAGIGPWAYQDIIPLLKQKYFVIIPEFQNEFKDIDITIKELKTKIDNKFNKKIHTLAGLSLGSQIALKFVAQYPNICDNLLLESCAAFPQFISKWIKTSTNLTYPLTKLKWFNKLQAAALYIPKNEYESYNNEIQKLSKNDLVNILTANTNFDVQSLIPLKFQGKVLITYGTKENKLIKTSSKYLMNKFTNAKLIPLNGYHHGELTIKHTHQYFQLINEINNN